MTGLFDAIIQLGYVWILSERATFQISLFLMIFYYFITPKSIIIFFGFQLLKQIINSYKKGDQNF